MEGEVHSPSKSCIQARVVKRSIFQKNFKIRLKQLISGRDVFPDIAYFPNSNNNNIKIMIK